MLIMEETLAKGVPVLLELRRHGYEAVFVGGCVRDATAGRPIHDIDIATSAAPEQVIAIFPKTIPTGLKHGTVTVMHGGEGYEVTTYRTESAYERHRRPGRVEFVTDLESDLCRRDFTINAIAMRPDGEIVDPFHGKDDMRAGVLRCVGNADIRFQEDALRMIRAVRFAAEFRLRIVPGTWRALVRHCGLLRHVAMERVGAELDKMIAGAGPLRASAWMAASGLLAHTKRPLPRRLLDEADSFVNNKTGGISRENNGRSWRNCASWPAKRDASGLERLADKDDRWAALCLLLGLSPNESGRLFEALAFSTARTAWLVAVMRTGEAVASVMEELAGDSLGAAAGDRAECENVRRKWIGIVLKESKAICEAWLRIALALNPADRSAGPVIPEDGEDRLRSIREETHGDRRLTDLSSQLTRMPVTAMKELAVRGSDLLRYAGQAAGPWLGAVLDELLLAAAAGDVANEREALLAFAALRFGPKLEAALGGTDGITGNKEKP